MPHFLLLANWPILRYLGPTHYALRRTNVRTCAIVTWDDWGGWFDHINPNPYPGVWRGTPNGTGWNCSAPNQWGCGYTYGFRVPLLVVSPYTGTGNQQTGYGGYVSGACGASPLPSCPNNVSPYVHDFGSILAFTEWNFGMQFIDETGDNGYADYNAPDWSADHKTIPPLADFFQLQQPRQFVHVDTGQWTYHCFTDWGSCPGTYRPYAAKDPDDY
jgi:hypothetical protein